MRIQDNTPGAGDIVRPYPWLPPVRNLDLPRTGRCIAFEGSDGAGKSTQIALLAEHLGEEGYDVKVCSFIRNPLIEHAKAKGKWDNWDPYTMALTYGAALVDIVNREALPHLQTPNSVVVFDRYLYSIIARSEARGCPRDWLSQLLQPAMLPHQVIHLRTPVDVCFDRKAAAASTFSYWECGIDAFGPDRLRTAGPVADYRRSFVRYQERVQQITDELRVDVPSLVIAEVLPPDRIADLIQRHVHQTLEARVAG